jgi:hypothetical protein
MIFTHINGVQRRKAFFNEFFRNRLSYAFNFFLMHLSESELMNNLKNDLVVGQLPLLSFCLLTVNKSARQLFKLFLICFAIEFTPHSGI